MVVDVVADAILDEESDLFCANSCPAELLDFTLAQYKLTGANPNA